MASATWTERARRLAVLPAVAIACLLAGCQAGATPVLAAPVGPPSGVVLPPAAPPIPVTVAPATVAPGALRVAPFPAGLPATSLPPLKPAPSVAPCPNHPGPTQIPVHVALGAGSARVSWVSDGDPTVRSYRVTAMSQRLVGGTQPAAPTTTTARGTGCSPRSVSFSGLRRATPYVFWLEEAIPEPTGGLRYWMVGQSAGVLVP